MNHAVSAGDIFADATIPVPSLLPDMFLSLPPLQRGAPDRKRASILLLTRNGMDTTTRETTAIAGDVRQQYAPSTFCLLKRQLYVPRNLLRTEPKASMRSPTISL